MWFGNVERVASERIGRETVTYVSNIYKYYITYRLLTEQRERRDAAKAQSREASVEPDPRPSPKGSSGAWRRVI